METRREHLRINPEKCTACHRCTIACSMKHHGRINPQLSRIKIHRFPNEAINVPVICMACENPPCIKVCPMNARIRAANGTVITDTAVCIGCRACIYICPEGSPVVNPYSGKTMTCDMCRDDAEGPWCVTACRKEGALVIYKSDGGTKNAAREQAARAKAMY